MDEEFEKKINAFLLVRPIDGDITGLNVTVTTSGKVQEIVWSVKSQGKSKEILL